MNEFLWLFIQQIMMLYDIVIYNNFGNYSVVVVVGEQIKKPPQIWHFGLRTRFFETKSNVIPDAGAFFSIT